MNSTVATLLATDDA